MGYDLSRVRPKRKVPKSKVAVDETYVEAGSKEDFITRCTNSRVSGGKRSTVCGERTAEMHWRQIRMYLGWIQAPQGAHIRDHLNIKDLTKALKHMETQPTIRKTPFKPGSVQLLSRSLSVAIQVFLVDRPLQDRFGSTLNFEPSRAWHKVGPDSVLLTFLFWPPLQAKEKKEQRRRKMNDLLKWLRSTAKSVAERLAQQGSCAERIRTERNLPLDWLGDGLKIHLPYKLLGDWFQSRPIFDSEKKRLELDLPLTGEDNSPTEMANMPAPLTLPQMMASVALHDQKIANLSGRIGKLAEGAKASNRLYMKYRLARLRAAKIAFLYTVQTCNRLQTTHTLRLGKNLVFVDENGAEHAVYILTGASPTKVETKRRLKRG